MEDVHISTDSQGTANPPAATPNSTTPSTTPPKHHGPLDQAKDSAKKVLALITGRPSG